MSTVDSPKPSSIVRVGLIGDGERLATIAPQVVSCPLMSVIGQAGMNQSEAVPDIAWHPDPRVLASVAELQAIVLATSTRREAEFCAVAAEFALPVWKLPPAGRRFADAVSSRALLLGRNLSHRVASWWEFVAAHAWTELAWPHELRIDFSELRVSAPGPVFSSWKIRTAESAGGVLADLTAYALLEALVATRGLPETVSACAGRFRPTIDGGSAPETEDTVVALLRYQGGGSAWVRSTWNLPPFEQILIHHGPEFSVALTDQSATILDPNGTVLDARPLPGEYIGEELLRFADQVAAQARERSAAALERHLAVSALLEAIYLAARTNQPESPRKLYEVLNIPEPQS